MTHVDLSLDPAARAREVKGVLAADAVWDGEIIVVDDLLVPRGRTLRIQPGTRVLFRRADTSRTEPEFLDNATELVVRGRILAEGTAGSTITFAPEDPGGEEETEYDWGGIVFDGGEGHLLRCEIEGAVRGVAVISSSPLIRDTRIGGVRHGIAVYGDSHPRLERVEIDAKEEGVSLWRGAAPELVDLRVSSREKEGLLAGPGSRPRIEGSTFAGPLAGVLRAPGNPPPGPAAGSAPVSGGGGPAAGPRGAGERPTVRIYRGESFIGEDTTWKGEVLIDGTVMVAPGRTLRLRPGTVVLFSFRDSNGDGIGESGIFIQGRILADGDRERPILFTAEKGRGPGLWSAINIMGSDEEENRFMECIIEFSYRGLHSHFSSFTVESSIFRDNYRALQFQESKARVRKTRIHDNRSALRFRDSTVSIEDSHVNGNFAGIQALRSTVSITGSVVADNFLAGLHLRESQAAVEKNLISGNSPGLRATEGQLRIEGNTISANGYSGVQLRGSLADVRGNLFAGNVGNGFSSDSPSVRLRQNSFRGNMRFALENNSPSPVDAAENFWGVSPSRRGERIWDGADDPRVGTVVADPPLAAPPPAPAKPL